MQSKVRTLEEFLEDEDDDTSSLDTEIVKAHQEEQLSEEQKAQKKAAQHAINEAKSPRHLFSDEEKDEDLGGRPSVV